MSEAENQLRTDIAESLFRFGETTASDKEYLLKAHEALTDELDKLEEQMEESGLLDEMEFTDDLFSDIDEDDDDEDDDPYGLFPDGVPTRDYYNEVGDDDPEDY